MTLYEINSALLECVDLETGEIIDEERLGALQMEQDAKVENIALWIKNLKAEAEAIKAEKQNLEKRQKAAENKAESLKRYLAGALNGSKFSTSKVAISFRASKSVELDEGALERLPEQFLKYKAPEPNKTELKKAIESGQTFEGVRIVENSSIQIR